MGDGSTPDETQSSSPSAAKRPVLSSIQDCGDVASFVGTRVTNADQRYNLLNNLFKPCADYSFPKHTDGRSFQFQWLQRYPWLVYSRQENGGFCLPCVLFATSGYRGSDPCVLVSRPLTTFGKALASLHKHADKGHHKTAVIRSEEFLKTMTHQQPDIQCRLNQSMASRISLNRQKLHSIFKTIVFCGQQNIALRGHRDYATDIERDVDDLENHGNFRALLNFRVDAGDNVLAEHLATAPRNATYTSKTIQNQMINIVAVQI